MQSSNTPSKIPLPFASDSSALRNVIPENSADAPNPNNASYQLGFPPITMLPIESGGLPFYGQDMNGILNALSSAARWANAGGLYKYDAAFANDTNVGGYPKGAVLLKASLDGFWFNSIDNNTSNPDTGGPGWVDLSSILTNIPTQTSISGLRSQTKTGPKFCIVSGYHKSGDGGGGVYFYDNLDVSSVDNGGTIIVANDGGRWKLLYSGAVNVRWFGALGDGSGATPAGSGVSIASAPWNTWSGTPFSTNPSYSPPGYMSARSKPFLDTDTWDFIGANLALWFSGANNFATYFPAGTYKINLSGTGKVSGMQGLIIMHGQEQMIYGDGPYRTQITPNENSSFFLSNNAGTQDYYSLLTLYRTSGSPSGVRDIGFLGPNGYAQSSKNLSLLLCPNINGVTFRDLWITSADRGISVNTNSGDSHVKGVTTEYLFSQSVYTDATSEVSIDFCNFWASASVSGQQGVNAEGRASVTNSRFVGFVGQSLNAVSGLFCNNYVTGSASGSQIVFSGASTISGNQIISSSGGAAVSVVTNSTICGNSFNVSTPHPAIALGNGSASSATNLAITGNIFVKTSSSGAGDDVAINAPVSGVNYTGAATNTCIIDGNSFTGSAATSIGAACFGTNTFNDAPFTGIGPASAAGRDFVGPTVSTGSGPTGLVASITGMVGQGNGGTRGQQRLTLVSINTSGASHSCSGFALYTNNYLGNAVLIQAFGSSLTGGTLTWGASGSNPTCTVTSTGGGTISWTANAIPIT